MSLIWEIYWSQQCGGGQYEPEQSVSQWQSKILGRLTVVGTDTEAVWRLLPAARLSACGHILATWQRHDHVRRRQESLQVCRCCLTREQRLSAHSLREHDACRRDGFYRNSCRR